MTLTIFSLFWLAIFGCACGWIGYTLGHTDGWSAGFTDGRIAALRVVRRDRIRAAHAKLTQDRRAAR